MKKTINTLKSISLLALILVVTIACDKDFANIDSDIQGIKNFNATSIKFPMVTYTKTVTPFTSGATDANGVQTNSLPSNLLGVYVDPNNVEFGTTTASIITQIIPSVFDKDFGVTENLVDPTDPTNIIEPLESVRLTIPYFSTKTSTDSDGNGIYELDSVFGNPDATFKLSIYESKYLLRNLDPTTNFEESQSYYSNQGELFCAQKGELLFEQDNFIIDPSEIRLDENGNRIAEDDTTTEVAERFAPRLDVELLNPNGDFWENLLFANEGNPVLSNSSNFTEFFRGLIFEVEQVGVDGSLVVLDFSGGDAKIVVDYTNQEEIDEGEETSTNQTFLNFTFNGIRVNTLNNNTISNLNGDSTNGDSNLYLKGGDGTMAVLDLFNGDVVNEEGTTENALDFFNSKKDKWLINEANLVFYVDQNTLMSDDEPDRILLMDLKNNTPIIDYFLDGTTNTTNPNLSKIIYSEILERDSDEKGVKYKFRLTNHINNILLRDSTNVKLGLYVSSNVNLTQNSMIQNPDLMDNTVLTEIPASTVLTPKSTILYGSLPSLPEGQRAEFEIFFTEPEN